MSKTTKILRWLIVGLTSVIFSNVSNGQEPKSTAENWIQLFNGKDLDGWTPKIRHHALGENYGNTFRVQDGMLQVRYDKDKYEKYDEKFGHLFYKQPYSHYRLRVEYRFAGD